MNLRQWFRTVLATCALFLALSCSEGPGAKGDSSEGAIDNQRGDRDQVVAAFPPSTRVSAEVQEPAKERWEARKMMKPDWEDIPGSEVMEPDKCLLRATVDG